MEEVREMYEWEVGEVSRDKIEIRKMDLAKEIKRISNVTLRGNFSNPEDRKYWEERLTKLNSQLYSLEEMYK